MWNNNELAGKPSTLFKKKKKKKYKTMMQEFGESLWNCPLNKMSFTVSDASQFVRNLTILCSAPAPMPPTS